MMEEKENMNKHYHLFVSYILLGVSVLALTWLFFFSIGYALNRTIENQDRMLCESAKISGNIEYLEKCYGAS